MKVTVLMLFVGLLLLLATVHGERNCDYGKYGAQCGMNCSTHCGALPGTSNVHCDRKTGECSEGCIVGWYGPHCDQKCSRTCVNKTCNYQNGHCTHGCRDGKTGSFCEEVIKTPDRSRTASPTTPNTGHNAGIIAGIVTSIAALAAVGILLIILWKRHVHRSNRSEREPLIADPLLVACKKGNVTEVEHILSTSIDNIDRRGDGGKTPVMIAAMFGQEEVMKLLKRRGADLSVVDEINDSILHMACSGGHLETVRYVLSLSIVNINSRGSGGRTPVMAAAEKGHREVVEFLVSEVADVSMVDCDGDNILHYACIGGDVGTVKCVLSLNVVDVNSRGTWSRTPVMRAAEKGHRDVVELLVNAESDMTQVDDGGNNILHVACLGGHVDVVRYLLSSPGVDINSRGEHNRTPVMAAAWHGHTQVVEVLVNEEEADISLTDGEGNNILHLASRGGYVKTVALVLSNVDVDSRGENRRTAAMWAAERGHIEVLKLLVSERADLSLVDDHGNTVLHASCLGGHIEMVKYVLSLKPGDISVQGHRRRTPLLIAARQGHRQAVEFLADKGACKTAVDGKGDNVLHLACAEGHEDTVEYVLKRNFVDINARNNDGSTAAMVAHRRGYMSICGGLACPDCQGKQQQW